MKRFGRGVNGVFVVDKPRGITSYDVVRQLKRLMPRVKIGYLGTLDPLATGVLPILLGEGTKLVPYLESGTKVYEADLHLGVVTDTQDREGRVLQSVDIGDYDLSPQKVAAILQQFKGRIMQLPPMYSALKQNGEPLYKLARRGEAVQRTPREVEIYGLEATEIAPPSLHLHIECSKGTYIRTMAHDIGEQLGCGAHLAELRRIRSGPFCLEEALTMDDIKRLLNTEKLQEHILTLSQALGFLPAVEVGDADALHMRNGHTIPLERVPHGSKEDERVVRVLKKKGGGFVAVGGIERGNEGLVLRPLRVFHDAIFTKGPSYGRDTVHTMKQTIVDQGGR